MVVGIPIIYRYYWVSKIRTPIEICRRYFWVRSYLVKNVEILVLGDLHESVWRKYDRIFKHHWKLHGVANMAREVVGRVMVAANCGYRRTRKRVDHNCNCQKQSVTRAEAPLPTNFVDGYWRLVLLHGFESCDGFEYVFWKFPRFDFRTNAISSIPLIDADCSGTVHFCVCTLCNRGT